MNLIGEKVRLVPLLRGVNDERGTLAYVLWSAIENAGDWDRLFWDAPRGERKGDLFHWCHYLSNDQNPTVLLMFTDKDGALAGLTWFNSYNELEKSANIHVWIEPAHRGPMTREMGEMATEYAFEVLKLKKVVGISPYYVVRNMGVKCGYKEVERGEYDVNGETRTVFRVERVNDHG
jgi:RimJ/RimL family protein N-acetyltransferase